MSTRTLAVAGVIALAVMARLVPHPPNFAPITALAVFGAVRYGSRSAALLAPLTALLVSDLIREILFRNGLAQQWGIYKGMWVTYGTTALIVLLGRFAHGSRRSAEIALTTVAGSCLFFLLTNFAIWARSDPALLPPLGYPKTPAGLVECYVAAIPFFRTALLGDLMYATALFGGWALAETRFPALRPTPATATA